MSNFTITVESQLRVEDRRKIFEELHRYSAAQTSDSKLQSLSIFLRNAEDNVIGGLLGETFWGWLCRVYVDRGITARTGLWQKAFSHG